MTGSPMIVSALALAWLAAGAAPALAQGQANKTAPAQAQPSPPPPPDAAKPPQPVVVTDPNLQVATVRLEGGYRASKVLGAAVYNDQNQQIGTIDDIILNHQNQADMAVISVGGFLGVGGKLVALPYAKIERADNGKVLLEDGKKENLEKMPSFTYAP